MVTHSREQGSRVGWTMLAAVLAVGCGPQGDAGAVAADEDFSDVVLLDAGDKADSPLRPTASGTIWSQRLVIGDFKPVSNGFHAYTAELQAGRKVTFSLSSSDVRVFLRVKGGGRVADRIGAAIDPGDFEDYSATELTFTPQVSGTYAVIATTYGNMRAARLKRAPIDAGGYALLMLEEESGSCFVAGTPISTPRGPVKIEDLQLRDRVYSMDLNTGRVVEGEVSRTWTTAESPTLRVSISDGTVLTTTPEHPFLLANKGRRFVPASQLKPGDRLLRLDAHSRPIASARPTAAPRSTSQVQVLAVEPAAPADVYNFSVKEYVNYFAGGVLVHNY